jgi:hypothetical protein
MEINRINYEKFFLLYLDRELSPVEKQEVEKFLAENTDLQKEFKLLQQTVLVPQDFVFEQKELLYRKEEKRKIVPFYRMQVAAAIAGLILGGWVIMSIVVKNNKSAISGDHTIIARNKEKDSQVNVTGNDNRNKASETTVRQDGFTPQTGNNKDKGNLKATGEIADIQLNENKTDRNSRMSRNNPSGPGQDQKNIVKKQNGENAISPNREVNNTAKQNTSVNSASSDNTESTLLATQSGNNNPESASVATQKSSAGLEVQPGSALTGTKNPMVAGEPVKSAPALAFSATAKANSTSYDNALMKDQEYQSDNAISVVALNDPNKVSRFFKKLTKRTPEETNARQIRVSVFQISY